MGCVNMSSLAIHLSVELLCVRVRAFSNHLFSCVSRKSRSRSEKN